MDDEALRAAVGRARRLSEGEPEPFRSLAFRVLLEHLLRGAPAPLAAPAPAVDAAAMDLTEFLAVKRPETHPDRVVAIAYHAYHARDGAGVTTGDLAEAYARARLQRPQNFPDVIATCVRSGRLVEGERRDGAKTWVVTRTGEGYVEEGFPGRARAAPARTRPKRRTAGRARTTALTPVDWEDDDGDAETREPAADADVPALPREWSRRDFDR
jgi:hypothetical protein